jgi:hypothetical protein
MSHGAHECAKVGGGGAGSLTFPCPLPPLSPADSPIGGGLGSTFMEPDIHLPRRTGGRRSEAWPFLNTELSRADEAVSFPLRVGARLGARPRGKVCAVPPSGFPGGGRGPHPGLVGERENFTRGSAQARVRVAGRICALLRAVHPQPRDRMAPSGRGTHLGRQS